MLVDFKPYSVVYIEGAADSMLSVFLCLFRSIYPKV